MRLLTVRGTVVSVEPAGTATLADCVVVGDPEDQRGGRSRWGREGRAMTEAESLMP